MLSVIKNSFAEAHQVLTQFMSETANLEKVHLLAEKTAETIINGNKVISCGNGGSMCDAMHFAEELTGRFRNDRNALPAIAISDPSHITCTGNDYGFSSIFSRYIEGVGQAGDLLLGISTSGNSPNIIKAVEAARDKGMFTVGLLGKDGGKIREMVDLPIVVSAQTSDRIQEIHIKIIHITIEATEKILFT
ncbi:D-sedoheptulose 7-phosphate isomerase [bacterium]|nr:D-sedoheptulose 7-phosphate isomerase [bacterium]